MVVTVCGCDERAGVANDLSGTSEAFGEQVLVVTSEVGVPAGKRGEEGGGPRGGRWLRRLLAADFGEHGGDAVVGEFLDQSLQLVALGAHESRIAARALWQGQRAVAIPPEGSVPEGVRLVRTGDLPWSYSWSEIW